ncbi:hypothetical protein KZI27_00910 (plasmid) [Curtobacterium sp. TC1]|uniref:hypothetical protein n=1 Tax=Curtobacterium sp. TC1 TaxID=2862880 RepID=UPI001C9B54B9|nr:hypothetical protein [Curtobacterium sp. TC1]QZQ53784.1 hypothetical protein KZI27_00910 [Curtobacterium sp. TC1]
MAWLKRHERTRTVDDVVALLHSDQEDDRAAGILDSAVPPVEVLALASRPGNGYRVRAALALCGALPADMRVQILRDEYAAATRKHAMPGFFFLQLETYGRQLARRDDLDDDARAAIAAARTMFTRWERATGGIPQDSSMSGVTVFGLCLCLMVSATFVYLALAGFIHVPEFPVPGLGE